MLQGDKADPSSDSVFDLANKLFSQNIGLKKIPAIIQYYSFGSNFYHTFRKMNYQKILFYKFKLNKKFLNFGELFFGWVAIITAVLGCFA